MEEGNVGTNAGQLLTFISRYAIVLSKHLRLKEPHFCSLTNQCYESTLRVKMCEDALYIVVGQNLGETSYAK